MHLPYCIISAVKTKRWYLNGKRHRENGPACEYVNGDKYWFINDKIHRLDGPAIQYADGHREWWINDKCHREDGPAIEYSNGDKEWYINDRVVNCSSQEEFEKLLKLKAFW